MPDLLDAFTRLLAYLGDDEAADGYQNDPSFVPRENQLTKQEIFDLLPNIEAAINGNKAALKNLEPDIAQKVSTIRNLSNMYPQEKPELMEYITDFKVQLESELPHNRQNNGNNENNEMSGGAKKSSKKRRSTRRKLKTRRANRKNMRKSRSRVARR
jgi:hypothetical protein